MLVSALNAVCRSICGRSCPLSPAVELRRLSAFDESVVLRQPESEAVPCRGDNRESEVALLWYPRVVRTVRCFGGRAGWQCLYSARLCAASVCVSPAVPVSQSGQSASGGSSASAARPVFVWVPVTAQRCTAAVNEADFQPKHIPARVPPRLRAWRRGPMPQPAPAAVESRSAREAGMLLPRLGEPNPGHCPFRPARRWMQREA